MAHSQLQLSLHAVNVHGLHVHVDSRACVCVISLLNVPLCVFQDQGLTTWGMKSKAGLW